MTGSAGAKERNMVEKIGQNIMDYDFCLPFCLLRNRDICSLFCLFFNYIRNHGIFFPFCLFSSFIRNREICLSFCLFFNFYKDARQKAIRLSLVSNRHRPPGEELIIANLNVADSLCVEMQESLCMGVPFTLVYTYVHCAFSIHSSAYKLT
jgi:hypothetical protein